MKAIRCRDKRQRDAEVSRQCLVRQVIAAELQRRFGLRPREAFRQALGLTQAAHVEARSIDGAAAVLSPVLELAPERRLETLVGRLRDVGRVIASSPDLRSSADARNLYGSIIEFCETGVARQLPK